MVRGILLAAGTGTRFGGQKLLYPLADGTPIGVAAARNLHQGIGSVVAVVRPGDIELSQLLAAEGAEIVFCKEAEQGMAASLVCGVRAALGADGWLIAPADMPFICPGTIRTVTQLIEQGAPMAAPSYRDRRGHPVGFGREFCHELIALEGDTGARSLLMRHPARMQLFPSDDPGVVKDIDIPQDIPARQRRISHEGSHVDDLRKSGGAKSHSSGNLSNGYPAKLLP